MRFWWWDDAVACANMEAFITGTRQRVERDQVTGVWCVVEVLVP